MQFNHCYHILNRAIGSEKLFLNEGNYSFFQQQWNMYINPIAETIAWCLMPNHFHFVVRIRDEAEMRNRVVLFEVEKYLRDHGAFYEKESFEEFQSLKFDDSTVFAIVESISSSCLSKQWAKMIGNVVFMNRIAEFGNSEKLTKTISQHFSNLFNTYSKAFNKQNGRLGGLFMQNFKRKELDSDEYYRNVLLYILTNPVKHGYCKNPEDWRFSSIHEIASKFWHEKIKLEFLKLFASEENLLFCLQQRIELAEAYSLE